MCRYAYQYYSQCRHGELVRISFCDKAKALGLPEDLDRYRHLTQEAQHQSDEATDNRPSPPGNSQAASQLPLSVIQDRPHLTMSATVSPEAAPARSWAQVASSPTEERPHGAHRIPRSVHTDVDTGGPRGQGTRRDYHQHPSHARSSLDTADYNKLNINIPLDPYSGFSMELTHEHGKVQQIVTRFESLIIGDGSNGLLSDHIPVHADDARTRTPSASTTGTLVSDTDAETIRDVPLHRSPHASSSAMHPHHTAHAGDGHSLSRQTGKGKGRLVETDVAEAEEQEPQSPRKSLPSRWTGKTQAPALATAARAMQREFRKKASQPELTNESGRKTIRGTRAPIDHGKSHATDPTTFLTKTAVEAVESDITAHALKRTPTKLRQSPSKSTLRSPTGSPLRDSPPSWNSSVKITVSPSRTPRGSIYNLDGPSQSLMAEPGKPSRAPSSISSVGGGYVTARQSPVSQGSEIQSFQTAPSEPQDDVSEFDLANAGEYEQKGRVSNGMAAHSRGKSEPHVKVSPLNGRATTTTRPSAPTLSSRTPHSISLSTDRKRALTLETASSSESSGSSSVSSRIPRIASAVAAEQTPLSRAGSSKSLSTATGAQYAATTRSCHGESSGMDTTESAEPSAIPLPETPAPPALRHVRTLNSEGATPILSVASPKAVEIRSPVRSRSLAQLESTASLASIPTNGHSVQDTLSKNERIESYLESTVMVPGCPSPTESEEAVGHQHGTMPSGDAVVLSSLEMPDNGNNEPNTTKGVIPESGPPSTQRQASRVASISSEATVKANPVETDPVLNDPSIIYSRRKSDATGLLSTMIIDPVNIVCMMAHPVEYTGSISSEPPLSEASVLTPSSSNTAGDQYGTYGRRKTANESSLLASLTSGLRAEAAEFVPQGIVQDQPRFAEEWAQPQPALEPFSPLGLDTHGNPLYHLMYPVTIGPGTAFDFSGFGPYYSPRKGKRKNWSPRRGRQNRSDNASASPTKSRSTDDTNAGTETEQIAGQQGDDTTPKPAAATLARSAAPDSQEALSGTSGTIVEGNTPIVDLMESVIHNPEEASTGTSLAGDEGSVPFLNQIEYVTQRAAALNVAGAGRTHRQDWPSMHRPPYYNQGQQIALQAPSAPQENRVRAPGLGFGSHNHHAYNTLPFSQQQRRQRYSYPVQDAYPPRGNGLYENRYPGGYRRNWIASAGVPLDATAPFPDPVAPTGPRRTENEPNTGVGISSNAYLGYTVREQKARKKCGEMIIDPATETFALPCHRCEPRSDNEQVSPLRS